eukprot:CAMPEP_0177644544 /NCGR_PEP_ID=MMETSP0447-20121125/8746_1 /TAXON_ID=0 /ORGANISM="Stygamoeba regulata, Strain BSH-02190019" /LENGTH=215 /DNA_ID=CAMNT_0019146915 /DNA_START=141 /DNA_END=788 /DNA_ORIENTATION=+
MASQGFGKMFVMLPIIFAARQIDWTVEENLLKARIAFALVHAALVILGVYLLYKIKKSRIANVKVPAIPGDETSKETTVWEHDVAKLRQWATTMTLTLCITLVMHIKFGFVPPLLIQSVMNPVNFSSNQLFKTWIVGDAQAEGLGERPWKEEKPANPFASLLGQEDASDSNTTDATSTTSAQPTTNDVNSNNNNNNNGAKKRKNKKKKSKMNKVD